jgi:hypothetical protein
MAESNSELTIMLTLHWRPIATTSLAGWQPGTRVLKMTGDDCEGRGGY